MPPMLPPGSFRLNLIALVPPFVVLTLAYKRYPTLPVLWVAIAVSESHIWRTSPYKSLIR